jgi:hypothetical protein
MRTIGAAMASAISTFFSLCCLASAQCDLTGYDSTPPPKLPGAVFDQYAHFEYASDVDATDGGELRIWNYILNKRNDRGIGASWPKAGIGLSLWYPLPPGQAACKYFPTEIIRKDSDAPVVYGTNQQQQPATVYVAETRRDIGRAGANIKTSYADDDGKLINVNVSVSSYLSGKSIYITVEHSPTLIVGIAGLPRVLTQEQIEQISAAAKAQKAEVERATYYKFAGESPHKFLDEMFLPEKPPGEDTDFLFFSGQSAKVDVETDSSIEKVSTDMIILDQKRRRPVFATDVSLLVPSAK